MRTAAFHVKVIVSTSALLILFGIGVLTIQGQIGLKVEEPIDLRSVRKKLVFRTRKAQSIDELNRELVAEVRRRKVSFILSEEDAVALAKAGASQLLIESIKQSEPQELRDRLKEIDEADALYSRFTENYNKKNLADLRVAIDSGKEFLKRYEGTPEFEDQADFVRSQIARIERWIKANTTGDTFRKH